MEPTFQSICASLRRGEFAPVYLLMGEESYYIDQLVEQITEQVLGEDERAFNLTTIFCESDTQPAEILSAARRYPVGAARQLVVVKEAQQLRGIESLLPYLAKPVGSTVLVISYKHGALSHRGVLGAVRKVGVVFRSGRVGEGQLPAFIDGYVQERHVRIDHAAALMLAGNVGADLVRLSSELDKLCIALPEGAAAITAEMVERYVGISKDFNVWELRSALARKDAPKAHLILSRLLSGTSTPAPIIISTLFTLFANLLQSFYAPDRSERGLAAYLNLPNTWMLGDYQEARRHYSATQALAIIGKIREADTQLKGIESGNADEEDIMRELLCFILL